jgi:hypothetical protein
MEPARRAFTSRNSVRCDTAASALAATKLLDERRDRRIRLDAKTGKGLRA